MRWALDSTMHIPSLGMDLSMPTARPDWLAVCTVSVLAVAIGQLALCVAAVIVGPTAGIVELLALRKACGSHAGYLPQPTRSIGFLFGTLHVCSIL